MESPESWFHRRATLYVEAQILFHLNQVGVWKLLRHAGALTSAQVAEALRLVPGITDTLLDYVHGVDGLLERDAEGRYALSEFGRKVVERFADGKGSVEQQAINMFDVRVGAYGQVWRNLGGMLRGDVQYGRDFHREGQYAENGVSKLALRFWDSLVQHVDEAGGGALVEVGLTTGLLERLAERHPGRSVYGLDRSGLAIERSAASAASKGLKHLRWLQSDFFELDGWTRGIPPEPRGLVFSLHFHELLAGGEHLFVEALRRLRSLLPGWRVLAFEQPRLPSAERERLPETLWLYAQSNILIHHLIGNGRVLSREAWKELGAQAGCPRVLERPCDYLGYSAFTFQL